MNFWINFWSWFFFLSLAVFAALVAVVLVRGFFDVFSLFKTLTKQRDQQEQSPGAGNDEQP
jgi:hypothetical protein